jgi:hypothetical protein
MSRFNNLNAIARKRMPISCQDKAREIIERILGPGGLERMRHMGRGFARPKNQGSSPGLLELKVSKSARGISSKQCALKTFKQSLTWSEHISQ